MKETKIKDKIKDTFEDLKDKQPIGNKEFAAAYSNAVTKVENVQEAIPEKISVTNILKQVLFFFPGAFLMFMTSSGWMYFALAGASFFAPLSMFVIFVWLVSALMVVFGIGDVRKKKHFLMPLSTMLVGFVAGITSFLLTGFGQFGGAEMISMLFLPLAFIMPFLTKFWVERNETEDGA